MKRVLGIIIAVLLSKAGINAQILVHDYPYDSSFTKYIDHSHWVRPSFQCHWRGINFITDNTDVPQLMSPSLGHFHYEPLGPMYGELNSNLMMPFAIVAFQMDGRVSLRLDKSPLVSSYTWDVPDGTDFVQGEPLTVVIRTGIATYNIHDNSIPDHGWFVFWTDVGANLTNGDTMNQVSWMPFYSMKDSSAPEFDNRGIIALATRCDANSPGEINPQDGWGTSIAEYQTYVPILTPFRFDTMSHASALPNPLLYQYGGQLHGTGSTHYDMDLHHGISGILHESVDGDSLILANPFDFASLSALGAGSHKVAAMWEENTGVNGFNNGHSILAAQEQANALVVLNVNVDTTGSTTPPIIPPPSTQFWQDTPANVQQLIDSILGAMPNIRICVNGKCTDPMVIH